MKQAIPICIFLLSVVFLSSCKNQADFNSKQREINFNAEWKFVRADVADAEKSTFDDSAWRILSIPHDYSIEDLPEKEGVKQIGPFSEESAGKSSTGHVVGGTAWYRKHFTLNKEDEGKIIKILFDGVYMNSDVWINGNYLGNWPYGYSAFSYDLTDFLNPVGEENILAVKVKNEGENSRWYSGSGIYRDVKLMKTNPVHIDLWGNFITTPVVSEQKAIVKIETSILNTTLENQNISVLTKIQNEKGEIVASLENELELNADRKNTNQRELEINNPLLWTVESPKLYTLIVHVKKGNKIIDETETKFGIRSIEFSPEKGFLLNGESVLLKGGCLHHDNGILGAAAFKSAEYRRVKIMKDNGFNAIRTAHNQPSEIFLDACDELGMLVIDESFDQWQLSKKPQDYNLYFDEWWERDLEAMVLRDRNHPSIITWSVGNEIAERADSSGVEIIQYLKTKVNELDKSRPVTQAVCALWQRPGSKWEDNDPAFEHLDVHGYNYQWENYESDHKRFPERIMIGTESFPMSAMENWQMVEKYPYVIGDFVWTGMDYFGEAAIGNAQLKSESNGDYPNWPWFNGYCGDISVLGYKKPQMYYRDIVWKNSDLEMLVHSPIPENDEEIISKWGWPNELKSWNWEGNEGKAMQVNVYSRCNEVRLELNGKVVGTKVVSEETKLTANFDLKYEPGELVAIGLVDGKEVAKQSLKSTGQPSQIKIIAEQANISISQNDLVYFNIEIFDENGLLIPDAEIPINFNIQGKCKLQAVGNGNPVDMKSFQQPKVNTFRGRCQLIVRACEEGGEIVVTAKSEGLETGIAKVLLQ